MPASAIRKLVPYSDAAAAQGVKVYHLNSGAPDIASPDCVKQALAQRCANFHHLSYTNSAGLLELRQGLIEKYYRKVGIELELPELIVEVAGSEAFSVAMEIATDPGDEIIVIEPFYTNYQTFAYLHNITLKAVHTGIHDDFRIPDISEFEKLLTPRTRAVLISDEVYREFTYTDAPHFSAMNLPGCEQNVILVDSVSKRYNLCGARVGCIASHNKDVMAAAVKFAQSRLCPPVLGQYAAIAALDTPDEYFAQVRQEYIRRRDFTVARLNEMEGVYSPMPYGAFYAMAELPVDDAEAFCKWLLTEFRVKGETTMMTPVRSFYKTPGEGINQVRIAYVLEVPEMKKALDILEEGLRAYPGRTI